MVKITGKNHPFLGVNNADDALKEIKEDQGRLGVFWHTQGSGKSFSMAFFSQKVLRKVTGTPLVAEEEKTREVFGDYVSLYNFRQSIEDGATVPLFFENRIPVLQLANENFNDDLDALIEAAELDEEQEKKLERGFARKYHRITRDDRMEKVAEDIVAHCMGRGTTRGGYRFLDSAVSYPDDSWASNLVGVW